MLFTLCLHWTSVLQYKPSWDTMVFSGNTMKGQFLLQQTVLEDNRPPSEPVEFKDVAWSRCAIRCCFSREMGDNKKVFYISFHFYPTYAPLSSTRISPQTVTTEELKLLHTTDPRQ